MKHVQLAIEHLGNLPFGATLTPSQLSVKARIPHSLANNALLQCAESGQAKATKGSGYTASASLRFDLAEFGPRDHKRPL